MLLAGVGCASETTPHPHAKPARDDVAKPRPAQPSEDVARFVVDVELPPKARAGHEALAKVHVSPRAPWHMNTEFPAKLRLDTPEGVSLAVPEQRTEDAERLDEEGLVFAIPFTAKSHGAKTFHGDLEFAVCEDDACAPTRVPVQFAVEVCDPSGAAPQTYAC